MPETIDCFKGPYRFLSNFSEDGAVKPTVEHQFQARKATTVEDAIYVMAADNPKEAKRRGRLIDCRSDWDDIRIDVMYELLVEKFRPPSFCCDKLLDTKDVILIEGNTWGDTFWGVCNGRGENYLGQLLMLVRKELAGSL